MTSGKNTSIYTKYEMNYVYSISPRPEMVISGNFRWGGFYKKKKKRQKKAQKCLAFERVCLLNYCANSTNSCKEMLA